MIRLFKDARKCPKRFWEAYGLMLLFVFLIGIAGNDGGWFSALVVLVGIWGIFAGCMAIYHLGQYVAYKDAARWAEETHQAIIDGQTELAAALDQLDLLNRTFYRNFQGPS